MEREHNLESHKCGPNKGDVQPLIEVQTRECQSCGPPKLKTPDLDSRFKRPRFPSRRTAACPGLSEDAKKQVLDQRPEGGCLLLARQVFQIGRVTSPPWVHPYREQKETLVGPPRIEMETGGQSPPSVLPRRSTPGMASCICPWGCMGTPTTAMPRGRGRFQVPGSHPGPDVPSVIPGLISFGWGGRKCIELGGTQECHPGLLESKPRPLL